jgi:Xaa-Pro dipeptidase
MIIEKIEQVQAILKTKGIDGWLIYDFQKRNHLAIEFLEITASQFLSRRFFYWIPASGEPVRVMHATDLHVLDNLPGSVVRYYKWQTLDEELKKLLKGSSCIAMEYSPKNAIPYVSFVDGGTLDQIREIVPNVISSSSFIQEFTCVLNPMQRESQLEAADILDSSVEAAWDFISERLKKNEKITEYDVRMYIAERLKMLECIFEGGPICGVNGNSSDPHYIPEKDTALEIKEGDFILIDLWCKKNKTGSIYADICRVGVAASKPTKEQEEIFNLVKNAQLKATDLVRERFRERKSVKGWEVDRAARDVIEKAGYEEFFFHRTGHNIYLQDHGPGTHMDSIETFDDREIIPRTCFSIEPGIYLPNNFGVRLEYDVFVTEEGEVEISGGVQSEIKCLL